VPFPGWTLPGVLAAGAVQNLIKSQRILPGRRFLVAGNGPLLLVAAHSIVRAGGTVVEIAESASLARAWRHIPSLLSAPGLLRRGIGYRAALFRAGVPLRAGHTVVEARGRDEVSEAVVAPIDAAGHLDRSRARTVAVDTVVTGFGLVPAVELTRLLGCRHRWDTARGGWIPQRSADFQTTVPGVFVVGDCAGIGGAEVALAEGRLAGLLAGLRLGRGDARHLAGRLESARRRLARLHRARDAIAALWAPPATYLQLLTPATIVCRCEEVVASDVARALGESSRSLDSLKAATRATMGRCQGRNCVGTVASILAQALGPGPEALEPPRARPPARPIPLDALLHEPLSPARAPEMPLA
jgi:hypothetical protein